MAHSCKPAREPVHRAADRVLRVHARGDGKPPFKGEMWFQVTDQPVFPVAGFWQRTQEGNGFTMVTCNPTSRSIPRR